MASERQGPETVLTGVLDRPGLYGVLAEIEALGLDLLEIRQLIPGAGSPECGDPCWPAVVAPSRPPVQVTDSGRRHDVGDAHAGPALWLSRRWQPHLRRSQAPIVQNARGPDIQRHGGIQREPGIAASGQHRHTASRPPKSACHVVVRPARTAKRA